MPQSMDCTAFRENTEASFITDVAVLRQAFEMHRKMPDDASKAILLDCVRALKWDENMPLPQLGRMVEDLWVSIEREHNAALQEYISLKPAA